VGGLTPAARTDVAVDVSAVVPFGGEAVVRGWVRAPAAVDPDARPVVLVCFPGGSCSTGYFDLEVPGHAGYSMADYFVDRGVVVAAFDHLGIGESSAVDDIFAVTPWVAAEADDVATRVVLDGLRTGTLVPGLPPRPDLYAVGVGHSMGGMLSTVQQARHRTFDALIGLGHGGDGLPGFLTPDELALADRPLADTAASIAECARVRFATPTAIDNRRAEPNSFFAPDVPRAVKAAFSRQRTQLLYTCGLTSMIPGSTDAEKAAVDVPLLLAYGDGDLTHNFTGAFARYANATDATLFVLHDSAHCHNQATTRAVLWDRMARWVRSLADV
jgi:alpha-beta hydrolase superfamily lysophospholipase